MSEREPGPPSPIAPLLTMQDLARILVLSYREVSRMRAAGRIPPPDLHVGKRKPRWRAETINGWIKAGGPPT